MAHTVDSRPATPISELRSELDRVERMLPQLDTATGADYLERLDRVQALFDQVDGDEVDLRTEWTRWSDLQAQIERRAGALVRAAGGTGAYQALRARHAPAAGPWWHLDELLATQRRRRLRRTLITVGVIAAVLAVAVFVYRTWLAPSPEVILQVSAVHDIESAAMAEDWQSAFSVAQSTLEKLPDNPELLLWAGVLAERLGDANQAADYLTHAKAALSADPLDYQLSLAQTRFRANDLDGARAALQDAELLAPDDPRVVFLFGNIAEAQGQYREAILYFERVAALAENSDPQLAVMSKMRMATLLQSLQMNPLPGAAATAAPALPGATPSP